MNKIVFKFGGSMVGGPDNFAENMARCADIVRRTIVEKNLFPIIVVSAIAGETRRLRAMCDRVPFISAKNMDMVLTSGEYQSVGLMSGFLDNELAEIGYGAEPLAAWQIPVLTDNQFGDARVISVEREPIERLCDKKILPVITGYQGVDKDGRITSLGFDGSDTTAIAVAIAMGTDCVLFKDVGCLYTDDPKQNPAAMPVYKISYKDAQHLAERGAPVVHPRAIEMAQNAGCTIYITNGTDAPFTTICAM